MLFSDGSVVSGSKVVIGSDPGPVSSLVVVFVVVEEVPVVPAVFIVGEDLMYICNAAWNYTQLKLYLVLR